MPATEPARPLAPAKRILGILVLFAVVILSIAFGFWLSGGFHQAGPEVPDEPAPPLLLAMVLAVLGSLALAAGIGAYAIVHFTNCLTFDFSRPFFGSFKTKLYLANLFVVLLIAAGAGLLVAAFIAPILQSMGLSSSPSFFLPMFGTFIIMQFLLMMWLGIWAPLEKRVITARMAALGITPEQMQGGIPIGISDPTKSSFRKMTLVEDDIGMLWVFPEALMYRGDSQQFDIPRGRFTGMERKADAGSTSAYAGAVHVIVRFLDANGRERTLRLYTEGDPTLRQKAKALDALAARIQSWIDQAPAIDVPADEPIVEPLVEPLDDEAS